MPEADDVANLVHDDGERQVVPSARGDDPQDVGAVENDDTSDKEPLVPESPRHGTGTPEAGDAAREIRCGRTVRPPEEEWGEPVAVAVGLDQVAGEGRDLVGGALVVEGQTRGVRDALDRLEDDVIPSGGGASAVDDKVDRAARVPPHGDAVVVEHEHVVSGCRHGDLREDPAVARGREGDLDVLPLDGERVARRPNVLDLCPRQTRHPERDDRGEHEEEEGQPELGASGHSHRVP